MYKRQQILLTLPCLSLQFLFPRFSSFSAPPKSFPSLPTPPIYAYKYAHAAVIQACTSRKITKLKKVYVIHLLCSRPTQPILMKRIFVLRPNAFQDFNPATGLQAGSFMKKKSQATNANIADCVDFLYKNYKYWPILFCWLFKTFVGVRFLNHSV